MPSSSEEEDSEDLEYTPFDWSDSEAEGEQWDSADEEVSSFSDFSDEASEAEMSVSEEASKHGSVDSEDDEEDSDEHPKIEAEEDDVDDDDDDGMLGMELVGTSGYAGEVVDSPGQSPLVRPLSLFGLPPDFQLPSPNRGDHAAVEASEKEGTADAEQPKQKAKAAKALIGYSGPIETAGDHHMVSHRAPQPHVARGAAFVRLAQQLHSSYVNQSPAQSEPSLPGAFELQPIPPEHGPDSLHSGAGSWRSGASSSHSGAGSPQTGVGSSQAGADCLQSGAGCLQSGAGSSRLQIEVPPADLAWSGVTTIDDETERVADAAVRPPPALEMRVHSSSHEGKPRQLQIDNAVIVRWKKTQYDAVVVGLRKQSKKVHVMFDDKHETAWVPRSSVKRMPEASAMPSWLRLRGELDALDARHDREKSRTAGEPPAWHIAVLEAAHQGTVAGEAGLRLWVRYVQSRTCQWLGIDEVRELSAESHALLAASPMLMSRPPLTPRGTPKGGASPREAATRHSTPQRRWQTAVLAVPVASAAAALATDGDIATVKQMLDEGQPVDEHFDDGSTALAKAAMKGNDRLVQLLLSHRADANSQCASNGDTPLHLAAAYEHYDVAEHLCDAGARLDVMNRAGLTAAANWPAARRWRALRKDVAKRDVASDAPATPDGLITRQQSSTSVHSAASSTSASDDLPSDLPTYHTLLSSGTVDAGTIQKALTDILREGDTRVLEAHATTIEELLTHSDKSIVKGAIRALSQLTPTVLAAHTTPLAGLLTSADHRIVKRAIDALCSAATLDDASLATLVGLLRQDRWIRRTMKALASLTLVPPRPKGALAAGKAAVTPEQMHPHVGAIVALLSSNDIDTRKDGAVDIIVHANTVLSRANPSALTNAASAIGSLLTRSDARIVDSALKVLFCIDDRAAVAQHAARVAALLGADACAALRTKAVLESALRVCGKFGALELGRHAEVIIAHINHAEPDVRKAAVLAMSGLVNTPSTPHIPCLVIERLSDEVNNKVRQAAIKVLGALEPKAILQVAAQIDRCLEHDEPRVREAAVKALGRLKSTHYKDQLNMVLLNDKDSKVIVAAIASLKQCAQFCTPRCKRKSGGQLVSCDHCHKWFHCKCVGVKVAEANQMISYECGACKVTSGQGIRPSTRNEDGTTLARLPQFVSYKARRFSCAHRSSSSHTAAQSGSSSSTSSRRSVEAAGSQLLGGAGVGVAAKPSTPPLVAAAGPKTESVASDDGHVSDEEILLESAAARVKKKGTMFPDPDAPGSQKYLVAPESEQSLSNHGGQGEIILVYDGGGAHFAAKFPRQKVRTAGQFTNQDQLMREIELWAQLADHPNVANLVDVHCEFGSPYLVLPYADLGNLADHIKRRLPPDDAPPAVEAKWAAEPLDWMIQLAFGLRFLHESAVVHGDIKPANILVYPTNLDPFPEIKVGFTRAFAHAHTYTYTCTRRARARAHTRLHTPSARAHLHCS